MLLQFIRREDDRRRRALAEMGIAGVEHRGISDLAFGDRKVGGTYLYRAKGLVYFSASLLVAHDLEGVERYLRHPPREPDWRRGRPHRDFMSPGLGALQGGAGAAEFFRED